jgi:hypothetical protein
LQNENEYEDFGRVRASKISYSIACDRKYAIKKFFISLILLPLLIASLLDSKINRLHFTNCIADSINKVQATSIIALCIQEQFTIYKYCIYQNVILQF